MKTVMVSGKVMRVLYLAIGFALGVVVTMIWVNVQLSVLDKAFFLIR